MDLTQKKKLVYYGGNYSTYVRTKSENEVNQMKAFAKQQEEIAHIKSKSWNVQIRLCTILLFFSRRANMNRIHFQCRYICKLGQASQVQAKDHRQNGGCRSGGECLCT